MPKNKMILTTDGQIKKIEIIMAMVQEVASSSNLITKIGTVTVFSGLIDFYTIQAARLLEQIILKEQLTSGAKPAFNPHSDSYFYEQAVDCRKIINKIKKELLPFKVGSPGSEMDAEKANEVAQELISKTNTFLNYRKNVMHHLGNPTMTLEKLDALCDKTIKAYDNYLPVHKIFFEMLQPYRFAEKELDYFYGKT